MKPFAYTRATDADGAVRAAAGDAGTRFLAGGTNLVDLMREGVDQPERLVDINRLPLAQIEEHAGGLRLGALARNSETARHPLVRERYPLVAQAILSGASPQLRNAATNGGNLMQRTRCYYFYDTALPCNKRVPGSGCSALEGFHRMHAILGASEHCIATHPSDLCVALAALEAVVQVEGPNGTRSIAMGDFHRLPGKTPEWDTNLEQGELITAIDLPAGPYAEHSHYLKLRDRASYAFALVSVAAALDLEDGRVKSARLALGGVAAKPWRVPEAEVALAGAAPEEAAFRNAAEIMLRGAQPRTFNGFKIELARRAIVRACTIAAAGTRPMDFYEDDPA
jgi:xanthine dehydrogenase YagS FAD-binding subunit